VLRLRQDARGRHKLMPPWEGPFVIAKVLKPGTYKLAQGRRSQTATRGARNCPAVTSIPPLSPRPAGERADRHAGGNRTKGAHPFDFDASSMEAQAHTSCNRRAGYYVQETAPPLTPEPRLLDWGTSAATRGDPAHGPTVATEHIGHGSVTAGEGTTVDTARNGPAVMAVAGGRKQRSSHQQAHVPSWDSERTLSHGVKTTCPCPIPRTARARTTAALRTTRPVALTLRQDRRHLWQAKQATLHLRHDDRVKKGVPRHSISCPFPLPLSLSCHRDREKGYSERDPSPRRKRAPSPPTDQRFEGWPLRRVQQLPQSTRAPRLILVKGSKAGPSKGFNGRLRPLGLHAHY
jgi:hypothetical protein